MMRAFGGLDIATTADVKAQSEDVRHALQETLQELQGSLSGTLGSVIVDEMGFPLAWDLKGGADPSIIATAGAMISRGADRSSKVLDFGTMRNLVMTTDKGSIGIFRVTPRVSLVLLLQPSTNNILVMVEVTKALDRLREVILPGY